MLHANSSQVPRLYLGGSFNILHSSVFFPPLSDKILGLENLILSLCNYI